MPKAQRYNIYAGEPFELAVNGHDENRSGRVNIICDRYLQIVADESPDWSIEKWSAVCDGLNGYWMADQISVRSAWAEIADFEGLGKKWGIDQEALAAEIRAMSTAQKVALIEIVERFWKNSELPTDEALKQAGAKIKAQ